MKFIMIQKIKNPPYQISNSNIVLHFFVHWIVELVELSQFGQDASPAEVGLVAAAFVLCGKLGEIKLN